MEHRYALIVGIDYYKETAHFIPLPFAQADASAFYLPVGCVEWANRGDADGP